MRWVRDEKIESRLKALHVEFARETIQIDDIDLVESLNRQVRLGNKLKDDIVLQYALAMEQPEAAFPMVIVNKVKKFIFLWSGNHRIHAFKEFLGGKEIECYVCNIANQMTQDILPRIVNTLESSIGQTKEESLIHAQHMIDTWGIEPKEVGRLVGLRHDTIIQYMRSQNTAKRIMDQGVNPNGFGKGLLMRLAPIDNAVVLRETTKFIKKNSIVGDEALRVVDDVRRFSTEADCLREVRRWEKVVEDRTQKGKSPVRTKNRGKFMKYLTSLHKFILNVNKPTELQLEPGEIERVIKYWQETAAKMDRLMREGAKA